jgi:hypothetical protein
MFALLTIRQRDSDKVSNTKINGTGRSLKQSNIKTTSLLIHSVTFQRPLNCLQAFSLSFRDEAKYKRACAETDQ